MLFVLELPDSEFVWSQHKPYALVNGECWIFLLESHADLPSPILSAPVYSGPAGFLIIHRVLSNAQITCYESNDLSNVQIEFQKPSGVVFQDAFSNSSVSNGHERAVEFQCPSHIYQNSWHLKVHLYLRIIKTLLMCFQSQCAGIFHCCEPLVCLLFSLVFHVYDIYINACLFLKNPCSRAIFL